MFASIVTLGAYTLYRYILRRTLANIEQKAVLNASTGHRRKGEPQVDVWDYPFGKAPQDWRNN